MVVLAIDVDADELCVLALLGAVVLGVLAVAELDSLGAVVSCDVERARCAALVATRPTAAAAVADVTVVRLVDVATVREVVKAVEADVTRDVVVARVVGGAVAIVVAGVLAVVVAAEVARVVAAAPQREPLSGDTTCGDAAGMPGLGWPTPLRCP